jgi:hypothetical protein
MKTVKYTYKDRQGEVHQKTIEVPPRTTMARMRAAIIHQERKTGYLKNTLEVEEG